MSFHEFTRIITRAKNHNEAKYYGKQSITLMRKCENVGVSVTVN